MIPVIWHSQEEGRGRYNCTAQLNDAFDLYPCEHYGMANGMPDVEGAVVVVHGGREIEGFQKLQDDIEGLRWCLLIYLGDEESSFPAEKIQHKNSISWVQEPIPGRHDFAKRFMVNGYGHSHRKHIVECEKDLLWFFGGQVTHERRLACVNALRTLDWGGIVIETRGYHQGISLEEYYRTLCRAKIVPCPSGFHSPDAARAWDALESGAIPILDDLSPVRKEPGFWKYVLGEHPLPVLTDWSTLPGVIKNLERNWTKRSLECLAWWKIQKQEFSQWLEEDLEILCTKN